MCQKSRAYDSMHMHSRIQTADVINYIIHYEDQESFMVPARNLSRSLHMADYKGSIQIQNIILLKALPTDEIEWNTVNIRQHVMPH